MTLYCQLRLLSRKRATFSFLLIQNEIQPECCFLHSSTVCEVPVSQNSVLSAEGEQDKDCCCGLRMYPGHRTCSRDIPFLEHPSGTTSGSIYVAGGLCFSREQLIKHSKRLYWYHSFYAMSILHPGVIVFLYISNHQTFVYSQLRKITYHFLTCTLKLSCRAIENTSYHTDCYSRNQTSCETCL